MVQKARKQKRLKLDRGVNKRRVFDDEGHALDPVVALTVPDLTNGDQVTVFHNCL